jgi:hypothetical protein
LSIKLLLRFHLINLFEISSPELVDGPVLFVVEVSVAAVLREEGVGQGPAGTVERVTVAVRT